MFADNLALSSPGTHLLTLPKRQQILLGAAAVVLLAGSLFITHSLIPLGIILGGFLAYAVIRNPVWSIFAFIAINVTLSLSPQQYVQGNAPSLLDIALGGVFVGITIYWIIRLKFFENRNLSQSIGQLSIALFMIWSLIVTAIGLVVHSWSINDALREILNLSPLFVLPILYSHVISPDSKNEVRIFFAIIISAIIVVIGNIMFVKSSMASAIYLYETDRGAFDIELSCFLIIFMTSLLMTKQRWWQTILAIFLLLLGFIGLTISFTRTLYVLIFVSMAIVILLGTKQERKRGITRLGFAFFIAIAGAIPVIYSYRIIRLLLMHFGLRFLSTSHFRTDLSLLNRLAEYADAWKATVLSPIFGYGFGARFRTFKIIGGFHEWVGFTHNSYLYIAFKTGLVGALLLCTGIIALFLKAIHIQFNHQHTIRSGMAMRACIAFLVLVFLGAFIGPTFDSKADMVWVGLVWGYFLSLDLKNAKQSINSTFNALN